MKTRALSIVIAACAAITLSAITTAQASPPLATQDKVETIEVGQRLARFSQVKPSTRLYLRYKVVGDSRQLVDIWRRQISFEQQDGSRRMHITWRWDSNGDRKFVSTRDYWFEPDTFRPLTIQRRLVEGDKTTVAGFRYLPDRIVGLTDLADNSRKDFLQLAKVAPYAFETDMELLQALPLRQNYVVRIPFYEPGPGQPEPRYYTYRVSGEDQVASADGTLIDCWIVEQPSDSPEYGPLQFWVSKKSQVVIREQVKLKDGSLFVKSLLTSDSEVG